MVTNRPEDAAPQAQPGGNVVQLHSRKMRARVQIGAAAPDITAWRLRALGNGYSPIPNRDKRCFKGGWNTVSLTPLEVASWLHQRATATLDPATGVRIENGLVVVDVDVPDPVLNAGMRHILMEIAPGMFEPRGALERGRDDGSVKVAFFMKRAGEPFTVRSGKWRDGDEGEAQRIEIFASERGFKGGVLRQVGVSGPNKVDDATGEVLISYQWRTPTPADVPLDVLPELSVDQAKAIALEFDRLAAGAGYEREPGRASGVMDPVDVYDLNEHCLFDHEGEFHQITLGELIELYWRNQAIGADTRCSSTFLGRGGGRQDRCQVGWSGDRETGHVTVYDYDEDVCHRPQGFEGEDLTEAFAEILSTYADDAGSSDADDVRAANEAHQVAMRLATGTGLTESGVAAAMHHLVGDRYRWDGKRWWTFGGLTWTTDRALECLRRETMTFLASVPGLDVPANRRLQALRFLNAVAGCMQSFAAPGRFEIDPYVIAAQTVAVDLRTGRTRAARPEDNLTRQLAFDPADEEDCPLWKAFLRDITLNDPGLERFLQQWMGSSLCGEANHQKFAFFWGEGGNGKSVFIDTMERIIGEYAHHAQTETFIQTRSERHSVDEWLMKGRHMVTASEVPKGAKWNLQKIKQLTGDATANAREMGVNNEVFRRTWTLTIVGNRWPKLVDVDAAILRRLLLVPFEFQAKEPDEGLMGKLIAEAPGILRWAINGAIDLLKHGLKIPARVVDATQEYVEEDDDVATFLAEWTEVAGPDDTVMHTEVFNAWREFARGRAIEVGMSRELSARMKLLLGRDSERVVKGMRWRGLKLTNVFQS